jgi:hypothetical protein
MQSESLCKARLDLSVSVYEATFRSSASKRFSLFSQVLLKRPSPAPEVSLELRSQAFSFKEGGYVNCLSPELAAVQVVEGIE